MSAVIYLALAVCIAYGTYHTLKRPRLTRNWSPDQLTLPTISTYGDKVTIHNFRQARYRSTTDYDMTLSQLTFDNTHIVRAWVMIEYFGNWLPFNLRAAHVLLSFELSTGEYICVSPEIRKQSGQTFKPLKGMFRGYEIMYVIGDERDLIQLRTTHRTDDVYLYPLTLTPAQTQTLFRDVVTAVNTLAQKPVFFNTVLNSCTTTIARHLSTVGRALPKWHYAYLFPKDFDTLLTAYGFIDPAHTRDEHFITSHAQHAGDSEQFSKHIRH